MNKEPLSTSTEEVPKLKTALLDKIQAEKKPEVDLSKKKQVNYQNQLVGDF
jgi:hypothetical protein